LPQLRQTPYAAQQGQQLYLLRLHEIDRLLGGVFDYIERTIASETLVILTADHGTPWHYLRQRRPADEPYLVDDRTAISLRMRGPGVPKRCFGGLTAPNLDLMPTLLARAGLPVPDDLDGQDLLAPDYRRDYIVSESLYKGVYEIAVRDGCHAYIEKYPLDEQSVRLTGPALYRGLFPIGTSDYSEPLADVPDTLTEIVQAHLGRVGLHGGKP
jgi:membrane-anchored protein YejM (alkaline phosphatase superfamily)